MMTIDEKIEVLQAYKDGKKIQKRSCHSNTEWARVYEPIFNFSQYDYRVVQEMEVWVNVYQDGERTAFGGGYKEKDQSKAMLGTPAPGVSVRQVLFREVV